MICPNCGGDFAEWAHTCPYCGTVNEAVDEQVYMEHMEQLRQRMDRVDEEAEQEYEESVYASVQKIIRIVAILVAVLLVVVVAYVAINRISESMYEKKEIAEYQWQKEEFPKLDALYEAGDYDGALDEIDRVSTDTDYYCGEWAHQYFISDFYRSYRDMQFMQQAYEDGTPDEGTLAAGLYGRYISTAMPMMITWIA